MKTKLNKISIRLVVAIAALVAVGITSNLNAQPVIVTNAAPAMPSFSSGLQELYDSVTVSTNYAIAIGGGRATTGNRNLAFADYIYNVSQNVGLVVGYDYLWTSKKSGIPAQANLVKGGITLSAVIYPLKNFGMTNVAATPFANVLMATGNGSVSEIVTAGAKLNFVTFGGGWNLGAVGFYEDRIGAGFWTAKYICGGLEVNKGF
jgi:hypothetical protein